MTELTITPTQYRVQARRWTLPRLGLFQQVDIASLVYFRIMFGAIMLWEVWRYFDHGWIARYYITPLLDFKYFGFDWVHPLPGNGMYLFFYVLGALAICILLGLFYRLSMILFFLGFCYVFFLAQTRYLNHFYLIALISFLMIFVPAHRALSVDAWLRPSIRSQTAPAWSLWMLLLQFSIAYFYAGLAKINPDWLAGEPMRDWMAARTDFPLIGRFFTEEWMVYAFSYGGMMFDLLIAPALLWRRTRPIALLAALAFHLMNAHLFSIGIFPWFMIAANLMFLNPNWPRRVLRLQGLPETNEAAHPVKYRRLIVIFLCGFFAFQLLFPLRHWLYPSNPAWSEEGHQFSWRMKLNSKNANHTLFFATDPATQTTWPINPRDYLTTRQIGQVGPHPDMLLQFAHYLANNFRAEGTEAVKIHVWTEVSLNDRAGQVLINPLIDLAAEPRTLLHRPWILPLVQPLGDVDGVPTLLIARYGEDSLLLANIAQQTINLDGLVLGDETTGLRGQDWGIDRLEAVACVSVNPTSDTTLICNEDAAPLRLTETAIFWDKAFPVYYKGERIAFCETDACVVALPEG